MGKIYSGRIVELHVDRVRLPNGREVDLEWIDHRQASAVVPLLGGDRIVLIHQYRYATGGYLYEIPAGVLDRGEDPEACARRELLEETGYEAGRIEPLLSIWTVPGFCNERIHLFQATDLRKKRQGLERDEVIEVEIFPLDKIRRMIEEGEIEDAKSIIALQTIFLRRADWG